MKRYAYRCRACGHRFDSDKQHGAHCPECDAIAARDYTSVAVQYHPTRGK